MNDLTKAQRGKGLVETWNIELKIFGYMPTVLSRIGIIEVCFAAMSCRGRIGLPGLQGRRSLMMFGTCLPT